MKGAGQVQLGLVKLLLLRYLVCLPQKQLGILQRDQKGQHRSPARNNKQIPNHQPKHLSRWDWLGMDQIPIQNELRSQNLQPSFCAGYKHFVLTS